MHFWNNYSLLNFISHLITLILTHDYGQFWPARWSEIWDHQPKWTLHAALHWMANFRNNFMLHVPNSLEIRTLHQEFVLLLSISYGQQCVCAVKITPGVSHLGSTRHKHFWKTHWLPHWCWVWFLFLPICLLTEGSWTLMFLCLFPAPRTVLCFLWLWFWIWGSEKQTGDPDIPCSGNTTILHSNLCPQIQKQF